MNFFIDHPIFASAIALFMVLAGSVEDKEKAIARHSEMLAKIEEDKADIENTRLDLNFTNITAPFTGRIQDTKINAGQLVHAQQDVLTTLQQIDPVYVVFNVSRRQVFETQQLARDGLAFASWKDFKVEVGQACKQQWIIKKGLKEGECVIYDGLQKIRPGMVVNIKDKDSPLQKG